MKRMILYILLSILIIPIISFGKNIDSNKSDIKCGTFNNNIKFFTQNLAIPIDTIIGRPILQFSATTNSKSFKIHYDTSGYHKVQNFDYNNNNIPDYIDSVIYYFDYVYNIYINEIGYQSIPTDDSLGGDDSYDIYIMNIGNGEPAYYGVTVKDFEIKPRINFPRFATHIFLDNDYSPYDSTIIMGEKYQTFSYNSFDLLKITIAHELHHAIQLNYGDDESIKNTHIINEMTSTWFEYRMFPDVKDYINYVSSFCNNSSKYPFGTGDASNGYNWALFGQYLFDKYNDKIILRTWQLIGNGLNAYKALDSALKENDSSLKQAINYYSDWLYYTGYRSNKKKFFPDAHLLPPLKPYQTLTFEPFAITQPIKLDAYEIKLLQIILPPQNNTSLDTLDVIFSNTSLLSAILQTQDKEEFDLSISSKFENNFQEIASTGFFYNINPKNENIMEKLFFELSQPITYAYPNPFRLKEHTTLILPIKSDDKLNSSAKITFFSSDMVPILEINQQITQINNIIEQNFVSRGIIIDKSKINDLKQGIYLFSIKTEKNNFLGKLLILK